MSSNGHINSSGYRFIALFYLSLFVVSTFFSGFGNMGVLPSFGSDMTNQSYTAAKDSSEKSTLPGSFPLSEGENEHTRKSENSDENSLDFDFSFSGIIRWVFGFLAPLIPSPSVRVSCAETPIWLIFRNLRI
jgi:hypothetical protein